MSPDRVGGATELDPDERVGLRFKHVTTRAQLDHLEQANIQAALQWLARLKIDDILTEQFIRELHRKLLGQVWGWAGAFRQSEKNIGVDPLQIPVQLRLLLDDVRYWVDHATYCPLECAVRFHHRLVFIHLFANGNGRHARIMADQLLSRVFAEPPIDWAGGADLQAMGARRSSYLEALRRADRGDYQPLLNFVARRGNGLPARE